MNCSEKTIQKYLDGALDAAGAALFKEHMSLCEDCRNKALFWENAASLKKCAGRVQAPEFLATRIMANLPGKKVAAAGFMLRWKPAAAVLAVLVMIPLLMLSMQGRKVNVTFKISSDNAHTVSVVGDFNNWDINAAKLTRNNGYWETTVPMKTGKYQYTIIIDGKKWILEPQEEKEFNKNMELYFQDNGEDVI
jgi:predicted anti-sigma-YlaC factor YlaD